jgi:hypothetical protein
VSPQEAAELMRDFSEDLCARIYITTRKRFREAVSLAITALEREAKAETDPPASQVRDVPEGWVLLPMCLTRDMLDAIQREAVVGPSIAEHVWKHILSAAPPAPNNPEGWQPIETAPRDGTEILGAFFRQPWADSHRTGNVVKCWWQPQFEAFISSARIMTVAPGYTFDDGETERYHSPVIETVSHWMRLPSPPAPEGRGDDQ